LVLVVVVVPERFQELLARRLVVLVALVAAGMVEPQAQALTELLIVAVAAAVAAQLR
jgi:hypothetical protein